MKRIVDVFNLRHTHYDGQKISSCLHCVAYSAMSEVTSISLQFNGEQITFIYINRYSILYMFEIIIIYKMSTQTLGL